MCDYIFLGSLASPENRDRPCPFLLLPTPAQLLPECLHYYRYSSGKFRQWLRDGREIQEMGGLSGSNPPFATAKAIKTLIEVMHGKAWVKECRHTTSRAGQGVSRLTRLSRSRSSIWQPHHHLAFLCKHTKSGAEEVRTWCLTKRAAYNYTWSSNGQNLRHSRRQNHRQPVHYQCNFCGRVRHGSFDLSLGRGVKKAPSQTVSL